MGQFFDLAAANLVSPMILFFALGVLAAVARSDLTIPEAVAKALALYLMLAIGFKGGAGVAAHGVDGRMALAVLAAVLLSLLIPLIAFGLLRLFTRLPVVDAAAVASHYGSISIVTFVAASEAGRAVGLTPEGYMVALAAIMETPAILVGLWLARRAAPQDDGGGMDAALWREIALNGSVVMLVGSFFIGWITGPAGLDAIASFIVNPFKGVLCLFLLDMGLVAGRGLITGRGVMKLPVVAFGLYMPLVGALVASAAAAVVGLSVGGAALLITLAASASYIAVPAAMRIALPEARPAIYLTLSLGVTFPFNLTLGIPIYIAMAQWVAG